MTNFVKITSGYRSKLIISVFKKWLKPGDLILDVGCGNGLVAHALSEHLKVEIVGCDIKNYLVAEIPFRLIKDNHIPIDKEIKCILLIDVLHHLDKDNQEKFLDEILRHDKKVLIFEAEPTLLAKAADICLNKLHYGDLKVPLSFRTSKEWQSLFKRLALKSTNVKLRRPFWYPFSHTAFLVEKVVERL